MHQTNRRNLLPTLAASALLATAIAACGDAQGGGAQGGGAASASDGGSGLSGQVAGAGASSQAAAMDAWIAGFQQANPGVTVSYDPVGSGGGREQFAADGTAFGGTDAAFEGEELAAAEDRCGGAENFIQAPGYISPIAIVHNVEGLEELDLSPETLAAILKGDITAWNDPAIAQDNPDAELPDERITVVHRSDESGTTENLQEYLSAVAGDTWDYEVSGDWPVQGQEAAQGTSGVVDAVENGSGTIGYADASQAGDLGVARIKVGEDYVEPTPEAAARILEASDRAQAAGRFNITYEIERDTEESGTYPIVLVSYEMACTQYDGDEGAVVKAFLEYVFSEEGQQTAAETAGSAPIPDSLRQDVLPAIEAIGGGSAS